MYGMPRPGPKSPRKSRMMIFTLIVTLIVLLPLLLYRNLPLPPGANVRGESIGTTPENIKLLIDSTAFDPHREDRAIRQTIFDQVLAMVGRADRFIYVDMFLWNPWQGSIPEDHRELSEELARTLIEKKRGHPAMEIVVLSDPINRIYGEQEPDFFREMNEAGIMVIFTALARLPDSNRVYARYWRFYHRIFSSVPGLDRLVTTPFWKNPFVIGGPKITTRQFGRMLLFKANHRKVVVTGSDGSGLELMVTSFNPADGSSAHSNMGLHIQGKAAVEALESELAVARWSAQFEDSVVGGDGDRVEAAIAGIGRAVSDLKRLHRDSPGSPTVQWLSERAISDALVSHLTDAGPGDQVRIAIFYLSDRKVVTAIKEAVKSGAGVRIIIDANKDAFGMKKIGVPNRQAVAEIMKLSPKHDVQVRWADTHGEQFHTKALSITNPGSGKSIFTTGSANWTRRNLQNLNLEANLLVSGDPDTTGEFNRYFDIAWDNSDGLSHTLPYEAWAEGGFTLLWKTWLYRWQEWSGMSTF